MTKEDFHIKVVGIVNRHAGYHTGLGLVNASPSETVAEIKTLLESVIDSLIPEKYSDKTDFDAELAGYNRAIDEITEAKQELLTPNED